MHVSKVHLKGNQEVHKSMILLLTCHVFDNEILKRTETIFLQRTKTGHLASVINQNKF